MRSSVVVALTSQLLPDLEPLPGAAWRAVKRLSESEIVPTARYRLPGVDSNLIQQRLERLDEYEERLNRLSEIGITIVTEFEPDYPQRWINRLGDRTASHLFVAGNPTLLNRSAVGVVGSRDLDSSGMSFCREVARDASKLGHAVISGGAKGADEIAMREALEVEGYAVGILADSLIKQLKKWDLDSGNLCLATPFAPDTGFQVGNAMARNKLVYAGSIATVVVSSAFEAGGTWAGATEALRMKLCPVLVRRTAMEGNQALLAKGGIPIDKSNDLRRILDTAAPEQGRLL